MLTKELIVELIKEELLSESTNAQLDKLVSVLKRRTKKLIESVYSQNGKLVWLVQYKSDHDYEGKRITPMLPVDNMIEWLTTVLKGKVKITK